MRPQGAIPLLAVVLLAACSEPPRPAPPYFAIPAGPPPQASATPDMGGSPSASRAVIQPDAYPEVQSFLPSHPEDLEHGPSPVPQPGGATQPFYAAPANPGPVTGYGTGGMALPPGAPPNPPYAAGGIGHFR